MKDSKKVRLLLLMVFLLSALSSACMGIVAYQLATGELPFEIEAQFKFRDDPPKIEEEVIISADVPIKDNKIDEATVHKEYLLFYEQRIKLKEKEKMLLGTQRLIDENIKTAKLIEQRTIEKLNEIKAERVAQKADQDASLNLIKQAQQKFDNDRVVQEKTISQRIATTLSRMEAVTAMVLISDLDIKTSAKLLNLMQQDSRSKILAQMVEAKKIAGYPEPLPLSTKTQLRKKANEIILELRKLKEDPLFTPTTPNPKTGGQP